MIPVRVSFRYEFIPVPTVFVYMIPVRNVIPVRVIYRYEFTAVLVPVRNVRTGMRFDHILYRYHVKEVRDFVPVGDEWPS